MPLIYFAAQGHLSLSFVLLAGVFGNVVSDTIWYFVGRHIGEERIGKIKYFRKRPSHYRAIGRAIRKQGYIFLYSSKFLYGMGIPAHILSGVYRLSFIRSLFVNILGSLSWLIFVFAIARGAQEIPALKEDLVVAQLVFAAFVLGMFGIHYLVGARIKKFFRLDKEEPEENDE